jgi:hypothetical protein
MEPTESIMIPFYRHLGKIFYSIAASDKMVNEKEVNMLKRMVQSDWINLENSLDDFGEDAANQIEIVFDWLLENEWDRTTVFKEFAEFKSIHELIFTERVKGMILKTANNIAEVYAGKNKSELVMISQLYSILTK